MGVLRAESAPTEGKRQGQIVIWDSTLPTMGACRCPSPASGPRGWSVINWTLMTPRKPSS